MELFATVGRLPFDTLHVFPGWRQTSNNAEQQAAVD